MLCYVFLTRTEQLVGWLTLAKMQT